MRDATELRDIVLDVIRDAYRRPYAYAESPIEFDTMLHYVHWFLAQIEGRSASYAEAREAEAAADMRKYGTIARAYIAKHPNASEKDGVENVRQRYQRISNRLGIE